MIWALVLAATATQSSACAKLADDYEFASKRLALVFSEGVGDNSAIRATMREAQETNIRNEASGTLALLQAHKCTLPTSAPDASPYVVQAMECDLAKMEERLKPTGLPIVACDLSKWKNDRR